MDDSLSFESFFEGAQKAAHKAMSDHARGEYDEFALHAGVAIERLAKAVLYELNPLYIASGKVHLGGPKVRIYTITATEALNRLSSLSILKVDADLKLLIEQRNGTVHASVGDEAKTHIPTLANAVGPMLKHLEVDKFSFWQDWTSIINMAVDDQRSGIERDVQVRIKQARRLFEERFKGLPPGAKERAMMTPSPHLSELIETVEIGAGSAPVLKISGGDCPACGGRGILTFEPVQQTPTNTHYRANSFACSMCAFAVSGASEMAALRKANTPPIVTTTSVPHERSLAPDEINAAETQTG